MIFFFFFFLSFLFSNLTRSPRRLTPAPPARYLGQDPLAKPVRAARNAIAHLVTPGYVLYVVFAVCAYVCSMCVCLCSMCVWLCICLDLHVYVCTYKPEIWSSKPVTKPAKNTDKRADNIGEKVTQSVFAISGHDQTPRAIKRNWIIIHRHHTFRPDWNIQDKAIKY